MDSLDLMDIMNKIFSIEISPEDKFIIEKILDEDYNELVHKVVFDFISTSKKEIMQIIHDNLNRGYINQELADRFKKIMEAH